MASIRRLAFRDRFVWDLEQVVSPIFDDCNGLTDRYTFPDLTTRVPFVMLLSQEQFTILYSAILTGADLAYPNTSHDVENLFLQMVTCPMNEFCAALLDCINNDPAIMSAIISALSDAGAIGRTGDPEAPLSDGTLENNLLPDGYSCTDDKAYGMALAITEAIHEATSEALQAIEVATNPVELAAEIGDNVPGMSLVFSAADLARWVQNSAQEEYDLAWSDAIRDELACLIWCIILDGCTISYEEIFDLYLENSLVAPPAGDTLEDWTVWLITIVFGDPLATVSTVSMMGLIAMRFGGGFGKFVLGIHSLETVIALAEDDTSNNWSVVCDPCINEWCYEWSVALGNLDDWTAFASGGGPDRAILTGSGWATGGFPFEEVVQIFIVFADTPITTIRLTVDTVPSEWYQAYMPDVGASEFLGQIAGGTPSPVTFEPAVSGSGAWLSLDNLGDDEYTGHLTAIRIEGTGVNPFGADNC